MELLVDRQGTIRCLYGEALELAALGVVAVRRASHVEPDASARWWVDLGPMNGPVLGPFCLRSQALAAEEAWLLTSGLREA